MWNSGVGRHTDVPFTSQRCISGELYNCFVELSPLLLKPPDSERQSKGAVMTEKQASLHERLKRMGYKQENEIKLYGQKFELLGDPIVLGNDLVLLDAIERGSGEVKRIRIPLSVVNMASRDEIPISR
jgi:hypothetical protein